MEAAPETTSTALPGGVRLVEAFVMPSSVLVGCTLTDLDFRRRYGLSVLAMFRHGQRRATHLRDLRLEVGDVLLLEGEEAGFHTLQDSRDLWLLGDVPHLRERKRKGLYALGALVLGFALGGSNLVPLPVAMLMAALAVVLLGCLTPQEVYGHIEWRLLILIGGMTSVGLAMEKTAAAEYLASVIVATAEPFGIYFVMATFAVLTILLTQPLSNAAAALVVLPVAIASAHSLGVNPRTFAVLVTLSASLSFITPFEPASLLVYGPGGYKFRDFVVGGGVLTAIALALLMVLVPYWWPLAA